MIGASLTVKKLQSFSRKRARRPDALVNNAVDAMPGGGRITLSIGGRGDEVWLTVRDTGEGMSEDARLRAFEPFYTSKKEGWAGLGLSIVYSIMDRPGGQAEVESVPGEGASVHLVFPAVP